MIDHVVAQWHVFLSGGLPGGLDDLLDDDVVFYSPIVFYATARQADHQPLPASGGSDIRRKRFGIEQAGH